MRARAVAALLVGAAGLSACTSSDGDAGAATDAGGDATTIDGGGGGGGRGDAGSMDAGGDSANDAAGSADAAPPCTTRVTYGASWIKPANHPNPFDDASGLVTWDGACTDDGANSYATLSNGWKPYFTGHSSCVIALDALDVKSCAGAPAQCATRVAYGPSWIAPANHPNRYDDVNDRVLWNGQCAAAGSDSVATLSNGFAPHFSGTNACALSFLYSQCGGLYANPVIPGNCPDPGVLFDNGKYVLVCTSGNAADAFPIRVSNDLASWTAVGHIFPSASKPTWAKSDFWAPEIHKVGGGYVAYFTARGADGVLAIGAATAASPTGPFTDIGAPIVHDPNMGLIDPNEYDAPNGKRYLLWKEDGNAVGKPTPIHAQELAADGKSLVGSASTLITNDQAWEGAVVEGPWLIDHGGSYYLFYSGNSYANASYAVGVARASSPLGPYTKASGPILTTGGAWVGPGHCSVVPTAGGDSYMVYHAWAAGHVNGPGDGRETLVDRVIWSGGWPTVPAGPSARSLAMP